MACSCITNRAYSILGSVSVFDIKIAFFGLAGPKALKQLFFVLIMFITSENMSCVHIKQ